MTSNIESVLDNYSVFIPLPIIFIFYSSLMNPLVTGEGDKNGNDNETMNEMTMRMRRVARSSAQQVNYNREMYQQGEIITLRGIQ